MVHSDEAMNDCTQNGEQQSSTPSSPTVSTGKVGFVRSSSTNSSSSFDSCSDLLPSLEQSLDKCPTPTHFQPQEHEFTNDASDTSPRRESRPQTEISPPGGHQSTQKIRNFLVSPSEYVAHPSDPVSIDTPSQCQNLHSFPLIPLELKDEHVKTEVPTMRDHVYGLASAISLSKVRSLAESTVEKISQLQTSFHLPTSYIFPLKSPVPISSSACPSEAMDVRIESCEEQAVSGMDLPGDITKSPALSANPLSWNDSGNAAYMPLLGDSSKKYSLDISSDNMYMQHLPEEDSMAVTGIGNICRNEAFESDSTLINHLNLVARTEIVSLNDSCKSGSVRGAFLDEEEDKGPAEEGQIDNVEGVGLAFPDGCQPLDHAKQGFELERLEKSIRSYNLHKKSSAFCHPLRTLSSGSGRPDLEEEDSEEGVVVDNKQPFSWTVTMNDGVRILEHGQPFDVHDDFADTQLTSESHGRAIDHEWYTSKGSEPFSSSGEQRREVCSDAPSCVDESRELSWNGGPILAEAGEESHVDFKESPFKAEQSFEELLNEERWKGLSIRLDSRKQSVKEDEKEDLGPDELFRYVEDLELNETYVDTVLDMEDVLLDNDEIGGRERFLLASSNSVVGTPRSSRDGSLSSSTSGLQMSAFGNRTPFIVDWVEVVGAKQRKGGSSFGERIVGVKDHTVYCIKVSGGSQEWEVLRRYRDFVTLYHQLRRSFNARTERSLPSPWKEVDRDSRKVFGSTHPNVIEVRSTRIEKCLQSLLEAGPPYSTSSPLYWFLSPQGTVKGLSYRECHHPIILSSSQKSLDVQLGTIESPYLQSPRSEVGSIKGELDHDKGSLALGKTVKLNLRIHPSKSLKQMLSAQYHSCAGCHKHLEVDRGLVQGFVQTLGWGKPRLCEYNGQLYCSLCHLNETAVLPAQVLSHWDFTPRRVSQLAKAYLDSIYDQPMLCVSAVNPYLYSRVPILSHVKETRRKLSKMLTCMLCSSRVRIFQTMASRRYLLENNDFFALRDLEDLSKGAFAVLPGLLATVLESLRLHITKQCSICAETGEWCGAGILCEEPFSPIFPFQEESITSCKVCHAPFHKACFSKYTYCPACPKDHSKIIEHLKVEEPSNDCRGVVSPMDGKDEGTSPSSLGAAEVQGRLESDKSRSHRSWPSFYSLLPKKRLW